MEEGGRGKGEDVLVSDKKLYPFFSFLNGGGNLGSIRVVLQEALAARWPCYVTSFSWIYLSESCVLED